MQKESNGIIIVVGNDHAWFPTPQAGEDYIAANERRWGRYGLKARTYPHWCGEYCREGHHDCSS